ncbi:MAG: ANTAR domain-containing protein [Clostridia bacterium]|nr:ANTAR domain-containing protein [Clostridia bacterium]
MSDGLLIVCAQSNFAAQLLGMISAAVAGTHLTASSGAEARRMAGMSEYAGILITGKLPDESGLDLALDLSTNGCPGVMIITERDALLDAHEVLDGTGVTILARPLTKDALVHSLQLVIRVYEGGGTLDKAKLMLMQMKNYNEPQAHRYIQKLAMDKRLPRDVAAQLIIRALERQG